MAKSILVVEPGILRRLVRATGEWSATLTITYRKDGKPIMEATKTGNVAEARKLRAIRIAAVATGAPVSTGKLTVAAMLDGLIAHHEANGLKSLRTVRGHVASLKAALGPMRARDVRPAHIKAMQKAWQDAGDVENATINKRCESLRRAFVLAVKDGDLASRPNIPRLKAKGIRGKYIPGAVQALLAEHLPDYVVTLLEFARLYGTRRGQLSRTQRAWVDRERGVIVWPPEETKQDEAHAIPLDEAGLAQLDRVLAEGAQRPWCPYLFHGPRCAAGRKPSRDYGCVGDFKKAWRAACQKAGLPVGRKAGGYTFHHSRNTAVTDLLSGGKLSTAEAMVVSGHKTESMIKHYNLGNVEALRERLEAARAETARLTAAGKESGAIAPRLHLVQSAGAGPRK